MTYFWIWLVGFLTSCATTGLISDLEPDEWEGIHWAVLLCWPITLLLFAGMVCGAAGKAFAEWRAK
jgi:hypothetical protein